MKLSDKILNKLISFVVSTSQDIIIPNYYFGGFECDLFKITKDNYVVEYEVKISRADFFKDFSKGSKWIETTKHDKIKHGTLCNRFFFVVPFGLVSKAEIPDYAGLIYYDEYYNRFDLIKTAKLIHRNQFNNFRKICTTLNSRANLYRGELKLLKEKHNDRHRF